MSYCNAIETMSGEKKDLHKAYHDKHYGFPIHNDNELFGRLILEINQAGLSWETVLKKEANFRKAYHNFNIKKVAAYKKADRERLLADPGIIRNRLKINAAIENAKTILQLHNFPIKAEFKIDIGNIISFRMPITNPALSWKTLRYSFT